MMWIEVGGCQQTSGNLQNPLVFEREYSQYDNGTAATTINRVKTAGIPQNPLSTIAVARYQQGDSAADDRVYT